MTDGIHTVADCPDCGRISLFHNRCSKCGGDAWLRPGRQFSVRLADRRRHEDLRDEEVMQLRTR